MKPAERVSANRRWAVLSPYRGGMLHVAAGIMQGLARADPSSCRACFGPDRITRGLFPDDAEYFPFPFPEQFRAREIARWRRLPLTLRAVRAAITSWKPTLIHINSGHWSYPWLIPSLARRYPLVATLHDVAPHPGERRPHHGWKLGSLLRHARRVIVHSEELRRQAEATWHLPPGKCVVVPLASFGHCAIPSGTISEEPSRAELLLYGRVYAYKGYDVFFRALPAIVAQVPHVRVTLAGAGDLSPWMPAITAAQDRIRVINRFVSDEETSRLFSETSIPVLPYVEASQSGVALLAAAHGRAVVASRVGAIPEAVQDGITGILVPPGDPDALARAVIDLLNDSPRRIRMGQTARSSAEERFGPAATGRKLLDVYQEALCEGSGTDDVWDL